MSKGSGIARLMEKLTSVTLMQDGKGKQQTGKGKAKDGKDDRKGKKGKSKGGIHELTAALDAWSSTAQQIMGNPLMGLPTPTTMAPSSVGPSASTIDGGVRAIMSEAEKHCIFAVAAQEVTNEAKDPFAVNSLVFDDNGEPINQTSKDRIASTDTSCQRKRSSCTNTIALTETDRLKSCKASISESRRPEAVR